MNVIKKLLTNILIYGTEFIVIMLSVFPIVWVALSSFKTECTDSGGTIYTANRYYNSKRGIHISVPEI